MALKTKMMMMTIGRFGQNIGIAFQLVDDWLDFVASADQLGDYHHCHHHYYLSMMIIMIIIFLRKTSWWSRSRPGHSHGSGNFLFFLLFYFLFQFIWFFSRSFLPPNNSQGSTPSSSGWNNIPQTMTKTQIITHALIFNKFIVLMIFSGNSVSQEMSR